MTKKKQQRHALLGSRLAPLAVVLAFVGLARSAWAQDASCATVRHKAWYETLSLRGYAQFRYNRLIESNKQLDCEQCDKSLGNNKGFFMRRARLVLSGQLNDRVSLYFQPDFASDAAAASPHFVQLRDLYFDIAFDRAKEFRARAGQSKVPYGFENLQSSQNRLALDRNDALNSAVSNERDIGVFLYWAPAEIRKRLSHLVSSGLKGSGDYGVAGLGAYNGQTANKLEGNNSTHVVGRVAYPFRTPGGQFIEVGIQGYTGRYVPASRTAGVTGGPEFLDGRAAASLVVYPQPFGFQAEYNVGEGPEFDAPTNSIRNKRLHGGYAQVMYMRRLGEQILTPFAKVQYYEGGKKHEQDARSYLVRELEIGLEWQPSKVWEIVALHQFADRAYEDRATRGNRQRGNRLRLQLQVNF